ncbi:MAG: carboxymuconolactone decarboxylase family protein [Gammaproteobacteria bacterium]
MSNEKREKGRELLDKLCGNPDGVAAFPERFRDFSLEHLFGDVWQGDDLALEERSLITCTILTALAREPEQRFHFAAAKRLGIPREKLVEMITHTAHYAGWPNAVGALRSLNEVWPEES